MMGITPHPSFSRKHVYETFKHFPELRKTKKQVDTIQKHHEGDVWGQKHLGRKVSFRSTHKLEDLSKSSYAEVNEMGDIRAKLFAARKKTNASLSLTNPIEFKKPPKEQDPLKRANQKLAKISQTFDPLGVNNHLKAFNGVVLNKPELRELMRRCLNIQMTPVEFDAFFLEMDADGSLLIDGVEFVRYFIALGNKARHNVREERRERQTKMKTFRNELNVKQEERVRQAEDDQIQDFDPEDLESALEVLAKKALFWDHSSDVGVATQYAFETFLTPFEFKLQLEASFDVKLSGAELGALISTYSTRGREHRACIDGYLFLKKFIALQTAAREEDKLLQERNRKKREAVNAMNQKVDYNTKIIGR